MINFDIQDVSAHSLCIMFSPTQMLKMSHDFIFKLDIWPPSLIHHRFQLFGCVACSSWEYRISPFHMASSYGPVQGWKGESVYSPVMSAHDITWTHSSAGSLGRYLGEIAQAKKRLAGWLSLHRATHCTRWAPPRKPLMGRFFFFFSIDK